MVPVTQVNVFPKDKSPEPVILAEAEFKDPPFTVKEFDPTFTTPEEVMVKSVIVVVEEEVNDAVPELTRKVGTVTIELNSGRPPSTFTVEIDTVPEKEGALEGKTREPGPETVEENV